MSKMMKRSVLSVLVLLFFACMVVLTMRITRADTFYTIRINYVFADGTPAHDPYVGTYPAGEPVDITVTNPQISGYTAMTAIQGGVSAAQTEFHLASLDSNETATVYYIAGLTHYKAMYYKQNIYDDLYTRDNTVPGPLTDRYGLTGSNPTDLEDVQFEGFTNLFHEPDAIAADGSTVFRVYYDRNYYSVKFDLGEGGYGVDPVYAKYQSVYHIGEPTRMGYTFAGWVRTDCDTSKLTNGEYGVDWTYLDENGDPYATEAAGAAAATKFTDGEVPPHDTYYRAVWEQGITSYSYVYWFQNATGRDLTEEELNNAPSRDAARALIGANYSVVAAKDIENVQSGTPVNLSTMVTKKNGKKIEAKDFFGYDLSANGDFPTMSDAMRAELIDQSRFYEFNSMLSNLQFSGAFEGGEHQYIEVAGDGTTRINVYFNRVDFTLKFYYARQKLVNGQATGNIDLTNSTKNFSNKEYSGTNYLPALAAGQWSEDIGGSLPHIKDAYLTENGGTLTELYEDYSGYRYYYYQVQAQYNEPLSTKWLIDAITTVPKKGFAGQNCEPGSWAVENGTNYYYSHKIVKNFTVKGIYERLGKELMFLDRTSNYQELHYLLSWTNTEKKDTKSWNYGNDRILHFVYQNYTQLLPYEVEKMKGDADHDGSPDGPAVLTGEGGYQDIYVLKNNKYTPVSETTPFVYDDSAMYYGIRPSNIINTTDSGDQYTINDRNKKTTSVYSNQVPTNLTGFELDNYRTKANGQVVIDATNTIVDWSEDTNAYRKATIKFFYHRLTYTLKYRNGNRLEEEHNRDVMYGAPLNSAYTIEEDEHLEGEYRYWYEDPHYFNEDLKDYYSFVGWYYTPYYYRLVDKDTATMPADDMTLYAKWVPKVIKVSFYPTYNDFYQNVNRIGDETNVNYGDYVPLNRVPIDVDTEERPRLEAPAEDAMFAGWYYLRDNIPVRFDPESIPVTALNREAGGETARLRLYAEWVTRDAAKYKISYVEKDHPENEVADATFGRAFVWKTKTFDAKGGSDLNTAHAWVDGGMNWWPTTNSHSIVVMANAQGNEHEYDPNTFSFEYIQKRGVYYRVEYLDAVTRTPMEVPPKDAVYTTHASVKEDAPFIPGYAAEEMSKTLVLSASANDDPDEQMKEELEQNVITFYYNKNTTEYVYEVEYYKQNINDDGYTLSQKETLEVPIAPEGQNTTVAVAELYGRQYPLLFELIGYTRKANATTATVTQSDGTATTTGVADDAAVAITGDAKTTVKIYFDRNLYAYSYQYVDYQAERNYLDAAEEARAGMWNGVIEDHPNAGTERTEKEVTIPAPQDLTHSGVPYTRIDNKDIVLTIAPLTQDQPDVNTVKVYYRKFAERELQYKLTCVNEDDPYTEVDYDPVTGSPLYGGLSLTLQTVDEYADICDVTFYNFNEAKVDNGGVEDYRHTHHYTFLGWFDNPDGEGTPLTTNAKLTKGDLGLEEGKLPSRDVTYYAVVRQDMVRANFELRYVDDALPQDDAAATAVVEAAPTDVDGSVTGSYFAFSNPYRYENNTPLPWDRGLGYTLQVLPKDDRVYKYELSEWWEEDTTTHAMIRHHNWHNSGWAINELDDALDRHEDKHVIAVFKRREVTELPYKITYQYTDRTGTQRSYVVNKTLSQQQLDERNEGAMVTAAGEFQLNATCVMASAPFETNHAQTLTWTDTAVEQASKRGDTAAGTVDRIEATIIADQQDQTVDVFYRLEPTGAFTKITTTVGSNRNTDPELAVLDVRDKVVGGKYFTCWEIRKGAKADSPIIAKCYEPWFTYVVWENYYITPVFDSDAENTGDKENDAGIVLTALDNSRNQWTDDAGNMLANAYSDYLYCDFEIAFSDGNAEIYNNSDYQAGVVFEVCGKFTGSGFDPAHYSYDSNDENLKAGIQSILANSPTGGNGKFDNNGKNRTFQVDPISTSSLTNRSRIEYAKPYRNVYKMTNGEKDYTNGSYILKARAYLIKDDVVTLSNPQYVCLRDVATQDLATQDMCVITP